jgi:hypothetical protein
MSGVRGYLLRVIGEEEQTNIEHRTSNIEVEENEEFEPRMDAKERE